MGLISECEYDEDTSENEEESRCDELWQSLLVVTFALYEYDSKLINLLWYFLNIDY